MKKLLICMGLVAASLLNATTTETPMAGTELQRLIECSARDAAFQAEMEVQAALLDAISGLSERMRATEENLRSVSIWTKLPSMTAAARSDMAAAQQRIDELERCSKDLQTCVNALAASADSNAIQASTVADLSAQVNALESSVSTMVSHVAQASDLEHLNMRIDEIETRLNGTMASFTQSVHELQEKMKVADATMATMKKDMRRRM